MGMTTTRVRNYTTSVPLPDDAFELSCAWTPAT